MPTFWMGLKAWGDALMGRRSEKKGEKNEYLSYQYKLFL